MLRWVRDHRLPPYTGIKIGSFCEIATRNRTSRASTHTQYETSKPILMSQHPRSCQPTLGPHLHLKEPELEHSQRTEERRRHRRIEQPSAVAQVSPLAHQRGDYSRPSHHLPKITLPHEPLTVFPRQQRERHLCEIVHSKLYSLDPESPVNISNYVRRRADTLKSAELEHSCAADRLAR
jgi:hypothetical protein